VKKELNIFLTAILFYTRIPVPKNIVFTDSALNKATRYFPLIGILVGSAGALVFWCCNHYLSVHISLLFSLLAMIMLTGAFHEDALADFCDGFGGGYNKERILAIMKDSHIGTYGTIGLILLLLFKFTLLSECVPSQIPLLLIAAHAFSRLNPVLMIFTSQYIRIDESSKAKAVGGEKITLSLLIAMLFGLLPLALLSPQLILCVVPVNIVILLYFRYYVHKKTGGYTGDILGALQQFSEIGFYVSFLIGSKILL
jgi:adenosylcobinamide-GDP ribazoletransferase